MAESRLAASPDLSRAYGGGRVSAQRRAIADTVCRQSGAFTIEDLAAASTRGVGEAVGTATLYRAVAALEASGWLERVGARKGSALYVRCDAGAHHHHLVCEGCGRTEPTSCPVQVAEEGPAGHNGFVVTRHEVTLYGLCPECSANQPNAGQDAHVAHPHP